MGDRRIPRQDRREAITNGFDQTGPALAGIAESQLPENNDELSTSMLQLDLVVARPVGT